MYRMGRETKQQNAAQPLLYWYVVYSYWYRYIASILLYSTIALGSKLLIAGGHLVGHCLQSQQALYAAFWPTAPTMCSTSMCSCYSQRDLVPLYIHKVTCFAYMLVLHRGTWAKLPSRINP